ncbi:MAG: pyridoxal phosphate-dependent aminotransferase [Parcubacteria group bacterium]
MKLFPSRRAQTTPASPIRKLYRYADAAKRKGICVFHLNIGQPDIPTPQEFFRMLKKYAKGVVPYAPSSGFPEVIDAWRTYYRHLGIRLSAQDISITTGGSEAIYFALLAVADPGDEIVVLEPVYTSYVIYAKMFGIKLVPVTLNIRDGFHLPSHKTLVNAITPRTRAIVICNPSNPTGTVFTKREIDIVAGIAKARGLFIIADETYREIVFTKKKAVSFLSLAKVRDNVILIDSASKRFNMCGARIGCMVSRNKSIMASVLKFSQGRLSSPFLEQLAVIPLLRNSGKFTRHLIREYRSRRDAVIRELSGISGVSAYSPEGAFYVIAGLPVKDADHFCQWMLQTYQHNKETVMLAPAAGFYMTPKKGKNEVRIAYVLDAKKLSHAILILKRALDRYPGIIQTS